MTLSGIVLDAPDARELAAFYHRLLGWSVVEDQPQWVRLGAPGGGPGLSFQTESRYVRLACAIISKEQATRFHRPGDSGTPDV